MTTLTSYETGQDDNRFIGDNGGTEFRVAQSFQIPSQYEGYLITSVELYLSQGSPASPSDDITVRIETDSSGPSGTLADANASGTIASASVGASYGFVACNFSVPFTLSTGTTYHIKTVLANQPNDTRYYWGDDTTSPGYADGTEYTSSDGGSSWSSAARDALFKVVGQAPEGGGYFYISS